MSAKGNTPTRLGGSPRKLTPDEERLQERLGEQYQLVDLLGSGGMGTVYKAKQTNFDTYVAIKIVRDTAGDDTVAVRRLKNEAQALAALEHPNIVRVMTLIRLDDNQCALVMEYAEGKDLASIISEEGKLAPKRVRKLLVQCAQALVVAHGAGIIHRDLKPGNILVTKDGGEEKVKILDFGLAKLSESGNQKLTRTGTIMGSPAYMSPEQCTAGQLDGRSDIYSLGCVFYEALIGHPPVEGDSAFEVLLKHTNEFIPLIDCAEDKALGAIIAKCTERDPAQRFASASELLDALVSNGQYEYTPENRATTALVRVKKRNKIVAVVTVALVVLLGISAIYVFWTRRAASTLQVSSKQEQARRLVGRFHYLKSNENQPSAEEIREMESLEQFVTDRRQLEDLGNAYAHFGLEDNASRIRMRVIQSIWDSNRAQGDNISKVARHYTQIGQPARARQLLDRELAYEVGRSDSEAIAKAEFDLMAFGELTNDKALTEEMRKRLIQKLKVFSAAQLYALRDRSLFKEVRKTNQQFAEDLLEGAPNVVP